MDFARYLPLSAAPARDETDIGAEAHAAVALAEAARLATGLPQERELVRAFARDARITPDVDSAAALAAHAAAGTPGSRPPRIRELCSIVRALLVLEEASGGQADLPDEMWGRVALYAATRTDFARRAALRGHTIAASDASWSFGRGSVLRAPQRDIVRFVLALSEIPPRAAVHEGVQAPPDSAPTSPETSM